MRFRVQKYTPDIAFTWKKKILEDQEWVHVYQSEISTGEKASNASRNGYPVSGADINTIRHQQNAFSETLQECHCVIWCEVDGVSAMSMCIVTGEEPTKFFVGELPMSSFFGVGLHYGFRYLFRKVRSATRDELHIKLPLLMHAFALKMMVWERNHGSTPIRYMVSRMIPPPTERGGIVLGLPFDRAYTYHPPREYRRMLPNGEIYEQQNHFPVPPAPLPHSEELMRIRAVYDAAKKSTERICYSPEPLFFLHLRSEKNETLIWYDYAATKQMRVGDRPYRAPHDWIRNLPLFRSPEEGSALALLNVEFAFRTLPDKQSVKPTVQMLRLAPEEKAAIRESVLGWADEQFPYSESADATPQSILVRDTAMQQEICHVLLESPIILFYALRMLRKLVSQEEQFDTAYKQRNPNQLTFDGMLAKFTQFIGALHESLVPKLPPVTRAAVASPNASTVLAETDILTLIASGLTLRERARCRSVSTIFKDADQGDGDFWRGMLDEDAVSSGAVARWAAGNEEMKSWVDTHDSDDSSIMWEYFKRAPQFRKRRVLFRDPEWQRAARQLSGGIRAVLESITESSILRQNLLLTTDHSWLCQLVLGGWVSLEDDVMPWIRDINGFPTGEHVLEVRMDAEEILQGFFPGPSASKRPSLFDLLTKPELKDSDNLRLTMETILPRRSEEWDRRAQTQRYHDVFRSRSFLTLFASGQISHQEWFDRRLDERAIWRSVERNQGLSEYGPSPGKFHLSSDTRRDRVFNHNIAGESCFVWFVKSLVALKRENEPQFHIVRRLRREALIPIYDFKDPDARRILQEWMKTDVLSSRINDGDDGDEQV